MNQHQTAPPSRRAQSNVNTTKKVGLFSVSIDNAGAGARMPGSAKSSQHRLAATTS